MTIERFSMIFATGDNSDMGLNKLPRSFGFSGLSRESRKTLSIRWEWFGPWWTDSAIWWRIRLHDDQDTVQWDGRRCRWAAWYLGIRSIYWFPSIVGGASCFSSCIGRSSLFYWGWYYKLCNSIFNSAAMIWWGRDFPRFRGRPWTRGFGTWTQLQWTPSK